MPLNTDAIDDVVLALLFLNLSDSNRAWKSLDWDALSRLHDKGLIGDPVSRAKSVVLTDAGRREAERLFTEYFVRPDDKTAPRTPD
ncbi:DUF6429 family protein [Ralstonia solanacearum]|uniref:DUF6429 family protein n=1 Tax=Ralstonia solanacearum TaxID=305 RepID=UPI0005AC6245|nr:DUF6429 family protein [Ralstonia solanacearum]MDC6177104.1 DUF6429 family protein [Ralstonia solanacearum]MDC6238364.1 DUF6429 family protein [Ralstonia solanacearum]